VVRALSALLAGAMPSARLVIGLGTSPVNAARLASAYERCFEGDETDDAVVALLTNDEPSIGLVLAATQAAVHLVSLPAPGRSDDVLEYADRCDKIRRAHGATAIIARDDVAAALEAAGVAAIPHATLAQARLCKPWPDGFSLTQYSSGSTGSPRPVTMSDAALGRNISGILDVTRPEEGDVAVSWLPLSHDMGLVGLLLSGVVAAHPDHAGSTGVVITAPENFLRSPGIWMDAVASYNGSFTAAPDFAYRLAAERSTGLKELGGLRVAIVGGEIVRATTLERFATRFGPTLGRHALCPAYGMAEVGLCVTLTPPDALWRVKTFDDQPGEFVSSGAPLTGTEVRAVAGDSGSTMATLQLSCESLGTNPHTGARFGDGGWYEPGDTGFVDDDGWVYVTGRHDNLLVVHGRNVNSARLEEAVGDLPGLRQGRVTALGLPSGEWVVLAETATDVEPVAAGRLKRAIAGSCAAAAGVTPDAVHLIPRGTLPVTTSGKLRRNQARTMFLTGQWDEHI
jgi:fatty-acyl-CoA synthase